jgi:hypothetical protein
MVSSPKACKKYEQYCSGSCTREHNIYIRSLSPISKLNEFHADARHHEAHNLAESGGVQVPLVETFVVEFSVEIRQLSSSVACILAPIRRGRAENQKTAPGVFAVPYRTGDIYQPIPCRLHQYDWRRI